MASSVQTLQISNILFYSEMHIPINQVCIVALVGRLLPTQPFILK